MTPLIIGNIQFTFALIIYGLIALWYVDPVLKTRPWDRALVPLLLVHAFRFGPLTLLMPSQVDPDLSLMVKETIAYGDFISALLAILAMILIRYQLAGGKILAWIFSVVGLADIVVATLVGIQAGALEKYLGFNLYILNFYVPMLIITHVLIIRYLVKSS